MLKNCGIQFDQLKKQGINKKDFAEWIMGSGLICNNELTWIVFHGSFDFGYLLKLLTGV
jgi:CCR4-NOT transcription complex subunit 7/8